MKIWAIWRILEVRLNKINGNVQVLNNPHIFIIMYSTGQVYYLVLSVFFVQRLRVPITEFESQQGQTF